MKSAGAIPDEDDRAPGRAYCGLPVLRLTTLAAAWRRRGGGRLLWAPFAGRSYYLTHKARVGIEMACRLLQLRAGDEVLVPAYNCGSELDPLLRHGLRARLYGVDRRLRIRVEEVESRLTANTRCVYVTHYFGWPQPDIRSIASLCQQRGIPLIEDCALSLFSDDVDGAIGSMGAMAVFSLPKTLPVPDGGVLLVNKGPAQLPMALRPAPVWPPLLNLLRLVHRGTQRWRAKSKYGSFRSGGATSRPNHCRTGGQRELTPASQYPDMPVDYYYESNLRSRRISGLSRRLLTAFDAAQVRQRRRANFIHLNEGLAAVPDIERVFTWLPDHVCPLAFPILVSDRSWWLVRLRRAGVDAVPWWAGFHQGVDWREFPEAVFLKRHVITLPIHQDLDRVDIDFIARVARHLSTSLSSDTACPQGDGTRPAAGDLTMPASYRPGFVTEKQNRDSTMHMRHNLSPTRRGADPYEGRA